MGTGDYEDEGTFQVQVKNGLLKLPIATMRRGCREHWELSVFQFTLRCKMGLVYAFYVLFHMAYCEPDVSFFILYTMAAIVLYDYAKGYRSSCSKIYLVLNRNLLSLCSNLFWLMSQ